MKHLLYSFIGLLTCVSMYSCQNKSNGGSSTQNREDTIPIEKFALEFLRDNPNFDNNEVTRQKAAESFKSKFEESVDSLDLLSGIPVEFACAAKCIADSSYMVQFQAWHRPSTFYYKCFDKVMIDIITKISEKEVEALKEKEFYTVKGRFISIIPSTSAMSALLGRKTIAITNDWGPDRLDTYNTYSKGYVLSLGMVYVDTDSIVPYE